MAEELFVDKHLAKLISRVTNVAPILDELYFHDVINQVDYDKIRAIHDSEEQRRTLLSGPLESSGFRGKQIFHQILIDELRRMECETVMDMEVMDTGQVDTMMDKKLLIELLNDLSPDEFEKFKLLIELEKDFPPISRRRLNVADMQETVELMLEMYSCKCVEVTKKVLKEMQRLSDISSRAKKKHFECRPTLIQRVETMTSVIELLLDTLADLSEEEAKDFKQVFQSHLSFTCWYSDIQWRPLKITDMQNTVLFMARTFGQQSVEKTQNVLIKMNRTDLVQRLTDSSSEPKRKLSVDEHLSALIHKVATMRAVRELLLETLSDLSDQELNKFKCLLPFTYFKRGRPSIPRILLEPADKTEVVDLMMERCGQQSVEVIREVFMDMKRTDLAQRLSETSSGPKAAVSSLEVFGVKTTEGEKQSVDEQWPALIQKVETMTSVIELLLETLAGLSEGELEKFKQVLWSQSYICESYLEISQLVADMQDTVFCMADIFGQKSLEKTKDILIQLNRTDLLQRLSDNSSGAKKKHFMDKQLSTLIQKVATMAAVKEMLLETLNDLSCQEFKKFKRVLELTVFQKSLTNISLMLSNTIDIMDVILSHKVDGTEIVYVMLQNYGQQSVELMKMIFKEMNRSDLVQRLSDTSSGNKEKQKPSLSQKDVKMTQVKEMLSETLGELSFLEIKQFKSFLQTLLIKDFPEIPRVQIEVADQVDLVELMVEICGQQSVEVTIEVLKKMNRMDLVLSLSDTSSATQGPARSLEFGAYGGITDETMAPVKEKLLETLGELSFGEIQQFKWLLQQLQMEDFPKIPRVRMEMADSAVDIVELMVEICGQQSVEVTRDVLKVMNRMDLVWSLSDTSSANQGPARSLEFGAYGGITDETKKPVKVKLLETLEELSFNEIEQFKWLLQHLQRKDLSKIPRDRIEMVDRVDLVELMVEFCGQCSVEVTREVLKEMNRMDLVWSLSDISSPSKGPARSLELGAYGGIMDETITPVKDKLLEILGELSFEEIEHLKWLLKHLQVEDCPIIPRYQLEMADMVDLVDLIVEICGQQSVEVTREILKEMNRMDLVWSLSDTSSAFKGPSRSLESEAGGAIMESNDWMKFEPEVNSTDADEDPTHSLLCDAGKFECSVSGLRWVCDKRVSFKYQFCSWEEHMERMESLQYMPAGPLMDITVTAGKLKEVYLPHWICTDDNPEILDEFAVLHIDSCGDVVEDASEVTSSHVKLSEPIFSPRAVLMKAGFPVKINCNVLIYKTNTAFLTLHIYLIPRDPGLGQIMDKRELSYGYEVIRKPHPERSLKLQDRFILTTDLDKAEIYPKTLKLRYENRNPNFFEVFVENPDRNFQLKLALENELEPVWICAIRKDEYQSTGQQQQQEGKDFVDKHWCSLIGRVNNLGPIMDNLRTEGVVHQEKYDQIMALPTTQERMRTLFSGPLKASGDKGKDIFYRLLQKHEPYLVKDLKGNGF